MVKPVRVTTAEEISAADTAWMMHCSSGGSMDPSDCFDAGWFAARKWYEEKAHEGIAHLDEQEDSGAQ